MKRWKWYCVYKPHPAVNVRGFVNPIRRLEVNSYSAIDLSICSSGIAIDFNWSVSEYLNGSDHFLIYLKFARNIPTETPLKWKPLEAEWAKYKEGIKLVRSFESFDCHMEAYTYFTGVMLTSAESSIPKTTGKPHRPAVPWWDKKCGTLRKITRRCYKKYKSSSTPTYKVIYEQAMAKQVRCFWKAKQN